MKTYFKYLIIGWSIVCTVLFVYVTRIMKIETTKTKYIVRPMQDVNITAGDLMELESVPYPTKNGKLIRVPVGTVPLGLTEEERLKIEKTFRSKPSDYVNNLLKLIQARGIQIEVEQEINDKTVLVATIILSFFVWSIPITVFSLLGLLFSRK